jgi:hypothetical protein
MAGGWQALAGDLCGGAEAVSGLGLSCQPSAAAVNTGHADVRAGTAVLAARLLAGAVHVDCAGARFVTNEAVSAGALGAVVDSGNDG